MRMEQSMYSCPECHRVYRDPARFCPTDGSPLIVGSGGWPQAPEGGRYELIRRLGRGGAGEVWLARDTQLFGRLVAIKRLGSGTPATPEALARLEREARNAAAVEHANLVRVSDVVTWHDRLAIVLQYVPGVTLDELVRCLGPLPVTRVRQIVQDVAAGLEEMHAVGLIHRDIKPSNIIIRRDQRSPGRAVILDFGIARRFDDPTQSITSRQTFVGTPQFMAPEQLHQRVVDGRADIYALAATACHLLLGGLPPRLPGAPMRRQRFPGGSAWPPSLGEVIDAALAEEPDRRPPTAQAFADRFAAACDSAHLTGVLPQVADQQQPAAGEAAVTVTVREHVSRS
jgi:eukaryotic-like serine/threonine-protein kinase